VGRSPRFKDIGPGSFVGVMADERVFRRRLERVRVENALQALFDEVMLTAKWHSLAFGELQVLDSVHTQADVDLAQCASVASEHVKSDTLARSQDWEGLSRHTGGGTDHTVGPQNPTTRR
jgi:hypothetical protein